MSIKLCSRCKTSKEIDYFPKTGSWCKACIKQYQKIYREKIKLSNKNIPNFQKCSSCGEIKPADCFGKRNSAKTGLNCQCKECLRRTTQNKKQQKAEYRKKYYEKLLSDETRVIVESKVCSVCKIEKPKEKFWKDKHNPCGLYSQCIDCVSAARQNDESIEKRNGYQKEYRQNNKDKIRKAWNEWDKNKRANDVEYRLQRAVMHAISFKMRGKNGKDYYLSERIFDYLPYTPTALKLYIESQWEPWMNWDNYGKYDKNKRTWQIDHIIPQSKLPYDSMEYPNFKKCWALSNLRPLETIENIRKGNKIDPNLIQNNNV